MWIIVDSLRPIVDTLAPAFSHPSSVTNTSFFLAWVMSFGHKTILRVAEQQHPDSPPDRSQDHSFHPFYNFFERSAWTPAGLAQQVAILILTRLTFTGCVTLLVDDTLLHKSGKSVWGIGWFRDAVASTRKRVATASGHNWVVVSIAFRIPGTDGLILALPLMSRLHRSGKGQPGCSTLARQMIEEVLEWFPDRRFTLVGDGAYAAKTLLADLPDRITFVGRLRGDAAVYDPRVPTPKKGQRGRRAQKGPRLPSPKQAALKADRKRTTTGDWVWQSIVVSIYGKTKELRAVSYEVVWWHVTGLRRLKIVVVRDPSGKMDDIYLFTTDLQASAEWVITQFAWRWSIEVLFRGSKQVMEIESPQHRCRSSVEKVAPWVWSMQSVIMVWYLTEGQTTSEAVESRSRMGEWDSEWSLRHMVRVMRSVILNATFDTNSADPSQLLQMVQTLKSWGNMAV